MIGWSSCPECGTILRIRDRSFVGRRVNCPECKTTLRIETANENGGYVTRRVAQAELVHSGNGAPSAGSKPKKIALAAPLRSFVSKWINSPLTAAWLLAIAVVALIAVLTLAPRVRHAPARSTPVPVEPSPPIDSKPTPDLAKRETSEAPSRHEEIQPERTAIDVAISISALEPANVEGPVPWPSVSVSKESEPMPPPRRPVKIDVESKMAQRFPLYKQPKPVSRRDLLESLQEQLGAPIHYDHDELGAAGLDATVTFELENTTVGGVIKSVADGANWQMKIEDTGLRLTRKRPVE